MLSSCWIIVVILQPMSQPIFVCEEDVILPHNVRIKEYKVLMIMGKWYILCRCGVDWRDKMFTFKRGQQQFICYSQRLIDEQYKASLVQLVRCIQYGSVSEVQNCWIGMFKIYQFSCKRIRAYKCDNPKYGQKIKIKSQGKMEVCVISNCFKKNNSYFYFTNREKSGIGSGMDVILDKSCEKIVGFSVKIGELTLCLPMFELMRGNSTIFAIEKTIEETIKRVVYISHEGSYCTGILFSPTYILTVKHLFSSVKPIGTIVNIRFYPYNKESKATFCGCIASFIDLVVLSINEDDKEQDNCQMFSKDKQQNIPKLQIGMNVHAIGFGKYAYSNHLFNQVDLLLPIVAHGIISKVIDHNQQQVYFKTDMLIYNGYSGCPIWHENSWLGNAFFIVRNPISSAKHPRHNFSYCRRFIQKFKQNHGVDGSKSNISTFLHQFQKIVTRKQLKIVAKL